MPKSSCSSTKLDRSKMILNMLDPRTDGATRLIALDRVDKMLKTVGLEWSDLAPLITPKEEFVKIYPGGVGLPSETTYQRGFKVKQL